MSFVRVILALACVSLLPLAFGADGDDPKAPTAPTAPGTAGVDLHSIIVSVSQRTHKKFLIDPRVVATVDLVGVEARDVSYPLLLSILSVHGFAAFVQDNIVVVVPDHSARQFASPLVAPDNIQGPDAVWVTTIVPVRNLSAAQLVPQLRPLMPQNASLSALTERNALLMVDRTDNVRRLVSIVKAFDELPE